jgi:plasmid stabilization system protein ParE
MRNYRIVDSARVEFLEAFDFYSDNASPEVAIDFLETFERAIDRLIQFPRLGYRESGDIRAFSLKKYPYTIFYLLEKEFINIVTFAHHSRGPEYLDERLGNFT